MLKRVLLCMVMVSTISFGSQWNNLLGKKRITDLESKGNYLWVGTDDIGVMLYDSSVKEWKEYSKRSGDLVTNSVSDILISESKVFIASNYGIYYCNLDGSDMKHYIVPGGYFPNWVRSIDEDKDFIWFGTFEGVVRYNKSTKTFLKYSIQIGSNSSTNNVPAIAHDDKYIWFGTEEGLQRYDKSMDITDAASRTNFGKGNGFETKGDYVSISSLFIKDSILWIGLEEYLPSNNPDYCLGGLYNYSLKDSSWRKIDKESGLNANGIHFINEIDGNIVAGQYSYIDGLNFDGGGLFNWVSEKDSIFLSDSLSGGVPCDDIRDYIVIGTEIWAGTANGIFTTDLTAVDNIFKILPEEPKQLCVRSMGEKKIQICFEAAEHASNYRFFLSSDGVNFPDSLEANTNSLILESEKENQLLFIKVAGLNGFGKGIETEVLAATSAKDRSKILIVNGFDRKNTSAYTRNYVIRHAEGMLNNSRNFDAVANDAIIAGNIKLTDYEIVDWILGDESTKDRTFNEYEQAAVKEFLENGGKLLVSGAEIGWDLSHKGTAESKSFYNNYLKAKYIKDAAAGKGGTYTIVPMSNSIFADTESLNFDNGQHGTIDINYPDGILPYGGSELTYQFLNTDPNANGGAGVKYAGTFGSSDKEGMLIHFSVPYESFYPEEARTDLMKGILDYFEKVSSVNDNEMVVTEYSLEQNYPNPFNPSTTISYSLAERGHVTVKVYDVLGKEVATLVNRERESGSYKVNFNASNLASGMYIYMIKAGDFTSSKKMMLVK